MDKRAEIKNWIYGVLADEGCSAEHWARKAGIAPSTLTRFIAREDAPLLGSTSIGKLEMAASAFLNSKALPDSEFPGGDIDHESLVQRATVEVLACMIEERYPIDPHETAAYIADVYRQYAEKAEARAQRIEITIAGNVIRFPRKSNA